MLPSIFAGQIRLNDKNPGASITTGEAVLVTQSGASPAGTVSNVVSPYVTVKGHGDSLMISYESVYAAPKIGSTV
jgi:hypothetical protein